VHVWNIETLILCEYRSGSFINGDVWFELLWLELRSHFLFPGYCHGSNTNPFPLIILLYVQFVEIM